MKEDETSVNWSVRKSITCEASITHPILGTRASSDICWRTTRGSEKVKEWRSELLKIIGKRQKEEKSYSFDYGE